MRYSRCGGTNIFYIGKMSSLVMFSVPFLIWAILAAGTRGVNADRELLTQHGLDCSKAPQNCFGDV